LRRSAELEFGAGEAQASAVDQAMAAGIYAPVVDLVAAPFKATRIGRGSVDGA